MKLPEPAFKNRHPPNPLPTNYYTEAQYLQGQRDALEAAAKLIERTAHTSRIEIRKLMEGL